MEEGLSLQAFLLANGNLHHECICGVTADHQLVKCEPVSSLACLRGHDLDLRPMLGWSIGEENLLKRAVPQVSNVEMIRAGLSPVA